MEVIKLAVTVKTWSEKNFLMTILPTWWCTFQLNRVPLVAVPIMHSNNEHCSNKDMTIV